LTARRSEGEWRWCSELSVDAVGLSALVGYATRTESRRPATEPTFSSLLVARDSHWTKGAMYSPMHGHEATTPALAAA
jgi:hypothetical protein